MVKGLAKPELAEALGHEGKKERRHKGHKQPKPNREHKLCEEGEGIFKPVGHPEYLHGR